MLTVRLANARAEWQLRRERELRELGGGRIDAAE